jgi:hypothetical protein
MLAKAVVFQLPSEAGQTQVPNILEALRVACSCCIPNDLDHQHSKHICVLLPRL